MGAGHQGRGSAGRLMRWRALSGARRQRTSHLFFRLQMVGASLNPTGSPQYADLRSAVHTPAQAPPLQEPEPELVVRRPKPRALWPPPLTRTATAPLPRTRPEMSAAALPALITLLPAIATGYR